MAVCIGTPRWSQRSYDVIFNYMLPAIILMLPQGGITDYDPKSRDWRVALFAKVTELISQQDEKEFDFIPVIATDDRQDKLPSKFIWSLADFMKVKKEDLPQFYVLDPYSQKATPYPVKLLKMEDFSAEIIFSWAKYKNVEVLEETVA